ncbi:hypothetical protein SVAN01_03479 [Stagonosporopsis vannaccii]|nr:hypothetical protein SVAN01_03479 [Stagonosporopsis vannaccii]
MRQQLDPDRSSCDVCHASPRCMASKWSAEIGWISWWRGQCFETRYMGLSESGIALSSAPCCFKTSVTGGNQDLVPAALRSSPESLHFTMTLMVLFALANLYGRRGKSEV